jgi:TolA-binding protein
VANARSLLGAALLGLKRYAEAEPLLLAGVQGLKDDEQAIPPQGTNVSDAMGRLVEFYRATGRADEAERWQKELEARGKR